MSGTKFSGSPLSRLRRVVNWPFALAEREPVVMALGVALAVGCWLYRASLAWVIFSGHAQPFSLHPEQVPVAVFLATLGADWLVMLALTLVFLALKFWMRLRMPQLMATAEMRAAEVFAAGLLVLLFALTLRVHHHLLVQLETGLTWTFVQTSRELVGTGDFFRMFVGRDILFLAVPLVFFVAALLAGDRLQKIFRPMVLTFTVVVLGLQVLPVGGQLTPELAENPLAYFLTDLTHDTIGYFWRNGNGYRDSNLLPGAEQMQSIALVDEAFVTRPPQPVTPLNRTLTAGGKPWNVLLFVMESTGSDYVFDAPFGQQTPMPFLRRLVDESLYCTNHFSACNSSPGAAFSILTGLYPPPKKVPFSLQKDATIPIWNTYLGNNYDCFLIHPSSSTYSFPVELFRNNGITNLYFQEQLPPGPQPDKTELARNEINTIRFLERRLDAAREPFLGIYWSFVPHFPYSDYGPDYQIRPNTKLKHDRYFNNLRLLDTQLERLFQHLKETGLADRTIVILVGDHGEAFGQHPGFWSHSFGSYAEMYRTPLVIWQPKLIAPRVVTQPTTHVDVLPTLLDVLGLPWNSARLQGESLLRESSRKYIFAMDAQADYVTSITTNLNKISICRPDDDADAFNLAKDPNERIPLNEDRYPAQIKALLKYCNYQKQMVEDYNAAIQNGNRYPPAAQ